MPVRIIESKHNARLKELRKALGDQGCRPREVAGIEGPKLIAEAMRAGLHIQTVFVAQGSERLLEPLGLREVAEVLAMPRTLLDSALATETPPPIAALVEPPDWTWLHLLGDRKDHRPLVVVLAELQDPGNLGTIIRSAEAFGATGIVSLPGTVNAWNPKAVRASAGSVFRVPVLNVDEQEALTELREAGVRLLTTTVQRGQPANLVDLADPVALIIGNEGKGVPTDLAAKTDGAVTIPCPGPVESLNAAVAASLLLYEATRQRTTSPQRTTKSGGPLEQRGGTR